MCFVRDSWKIRLKVIAELLYLYINMVGHGPVRGLPGQLLPTLYLVLLL